VTLVFSIITPIFDPPEDVLRACIDSVLQQDYPHLELCLVDDASPSPHVRRVLEEARQRDSRVRVIFRETYGGTVAASNDALTMANGDFVALVDYDGLLEPRALGVINHYIEAGEGDGVDYLYTDEDQIEPDGTCINAFYKPDWSPERFRSQMYTGHLSVIRRSLAVALDGFRSGFEGAHEYDLILRLTEQARRIEHVAEVLYHSRILVTPAANGPEEYTDEAGVRAVESHCERVGITATVTKLALPGTRRLRRAVVGEPKVSIIIPTGGTKRRVWGRERVLVTEVVRSMLEKSSYTNLELVIVADRTTPTTTIADLHDLLGDRLNLIWFDGPFHFSRKTNLGAAHATGEFLLLMNDDMEVISEDWLETMLGLAQDPTVGLVGNKLLFSDGRLQHAGHIYANSRPDHAFSHFSASEPGPSCMLQIDRECSGVTAACAVLRADVWHQAGGLTDLLPNSYNDVDLCLKVRHLGYRIVWTPHAQLYHFESMSRDSTATAEEFSFIRTRWDEQLRVDPYGNPALDPNRPDWVRADSRFSRSCERSHFETAHDSVRKF
jgi:O-antigen biosynthesis protein